MNSIWPNYYKAQIPVCCVDAGNKRICISYCAYRFNSATSPKTESTPFIGHKPKYTGVIQTTGGQSVWQRRSGLHLQTFRNGSRPRSSAGSIYSGSGFRTGLCAPLAVRRSITPSTAGTCASARSAVSRLL